MILGNFKGNWNFKVVGPGGVGPLPYAVASGGPRVPYPFFKVLSCVMCFFVTVVLQLPSGPTGESVRVCVCMLFDVFLVWCLFLNEFVCICF